MARTKPARKPSSLRTQLTRLILSLAVIGAGIGTLILRSQQTSMPATLAAIMAAILAATLVAILAAAGLARWILIPIHQLVEAARRIEQGDLSARADLKGGAELIALGQALNSMAGQLQQTLAGLEQHVTERTHELDLRNDRLQAAAEIASAFGDVVAAGSRPLRGSQPNELLSRAANLIRDRFGFTQVRIFTLDETGEWVFLRARAGELLPPCPTEPGSASGSDAASTSSTDRPPEGAPFAPDAPFAEGAPFAPDYPTKDRVAFRLHGDSSPGQNPGRSREPGPVVLAVENGQPQLSSVGPGLPGAAAPAAYRELSIPLRIGDRVTGVLDICSPQEYGLSAPDSPQPRQSAARTVCGQPSGASLRSVSGQASRLPEDLTVLQILANQLAIAIRNAQLFQELQDRLRELENLVTAQTQETWLRLARAGLPGCQYNLGEISSGTISPGDPSLLGQPGASPITIPITLRGQVIAALDVWPQTASPQAALPEVVPGQMPAGAWPAEKMDMLHAIGDRLSQTIDSARLFEEVQRRASRERIITEITSRVRASTNMDVIMRTAIQELAEKLDISTASIQIRTSDGEETDA